MCVLVIQSCLTLCDPLDCSPPGSSVHGILQARILDWVAFPFSRGSSWPKRQTCDSCIAGRFFTIWAVREAHVYMCISVCVYMYTFLPPDLKRRKQWSPETGMVYLRIWAVMTYYLLFLSGRIARPEKHQVLWYHVCPSQQGTGKFPSEYFGRKTWEMQAGW